MFERFTDRARRSIVHAQLEARQLGHEHLGTEHLLLGLLHEPEGVAGKVLARKGVELDRVRALVIRTIGRARELGDDGEVLAAIGIDLDEVRRTVDAAFGPHALDRAMLRQGSASPRFAPRTKQVLQLSLREALALGHGYVGTEHMLLGLCRLNEGVAVEILRALGASPSDLRESTIAFLGEITAM